MLSNITVDGHASVQTILLGQPQFRATLANPNLDQLRQRVLASYHLGPLTEAETRAYIEHRLKCVGWNGDPRWEDAAFTYTYRCTDGIPRRVNTLCSRVLLYGAIEEAHTITGPMVETTANELSQDLGAGLAARQMDAMTMHPGSASTDDSLVRRIEALERTSARQERVFRRLMDLLSAVADR
jgi:general secretion pathway protein A